MKLELDDSRRLTGKNLLWDHPGSVIDTFVAGVDKQQVVDCWQHHIQRLLDALQWSDAQTTYRIFENGVSLAISSPVDTLYAACEINEAAWKLCCEQLEGKAHGDEPLSDLLVLELLQFVREESNPRLLAIIAEAERRGVPWLTDDTEFSLGYGKTSRTWVNCELPDVDKIDWDKYQSIPVVFVTGTNGKSTSVRLAAQLVKQSGKCCGVTSTDYIRVGDKIIDYGDYSGPGGARSLLRHPDVEVALLEVARGGILRRGLPLPHVDVALVTNIAEDHLGQYGINSIQGLTATKFVVAKAVDQNGMLVLNADDPEVVRCGNEINKPKCWFSCDQHNSVVQAHVAKGGVACFVRDGWMAYQDKDGIKDIVAVPAVPMTFNGAAIHNIQNALGAIGVGKALNISDDDIATALTHFRSDADDNPGRGNLFSVKGASVVMDFAHNEHSMRAIVTATNNMPSKHKWLMMSAGGDRSDHDIGLMAKAGLALRPDKVVIAELEDYLRGREKGEIPALMTGLAKSHGLTEADIHVADSPFDAAQYILENLQPDDLALMLVLSERDKVVELIRRYQS